jgi:hypothetical protein
MLRRRERRWKRRARIIGPFLGVSVLLATLALSVDLIEYQPQAARSRPSDQPPPNQPPEQHPGMDISLAKSVSTASVVTAAPKNVGVENPGLDVILMPAETGTDTQPVQNPAAPVHPYALHGRR